MCYWFEWHFHDSLSYNGVISIYLFYLFIHLFMFLFTEPFGSSVTGAQRGLGVRGLQLDYGLGRPVGCSSTLGCDCSCSSWAPWAPILHLWCGCKLDIKLFLYLFGIYIQAGSVQLLKAGLHVSINDNKARWPYWEPHSLLFVEVCEFFYSLTPKIWLLINSPLSRCCTSAYSSVMKTFVLDQENILYLISLSILITKH